MKLLQITDGITTIDFLDMASGYSLEEEGYAPAVANVENSQLAGRSRYTTVQDSMQILVHDTTTTTANENLIALRLLMEKAERWGRGERVEPVRIRLQIADGGLPQENVIYSPSGNGVIMTLPPQHMSIDIVRISYPVTLRFTRRGEWLAYSANLLPNSSFEIFAGGQFAGWTMVGMVTQSGAENVFGDYSALVGSSGDELFVDITDTVEGKVYTVSVWVKNINIATTSSLIASDAATGSNPVLITSSGLESVNWQRLQVTKVAPAAGIRVEILSNDSAYFDGAQLELGATATPWSDEDLFIATSTAATVPSIHTLTWDSDQHSAGHMNPTDLVLSYFRDSTPNNSRKNETLFVVTDTVDDIGLFNRDSEVPFFGGSFNDSARSPSAASNVIWAGNGVVIDFQDNTDGLFVVKNDVFPSKDVFSMSVFATFRTTDSRVYPVTMAASWGGTRIEAEPVIIQSDDEDPFIVYLGSVTTDIPIEGVIIYQSVDSVGGEVASSILVDSILCINNDAPSTNVVLLENEETTLPVFTGPVYRNTFFALSSGNVPNNYISHSKVLRTSATSGGEIIEVMNFQGDLSLATVGQSFVACALTVRETYWTMSNTTGDKFQAQYTATRAVTNLVPK